MVYTITLNPSIDYYIDEDYQLNKINKVSNSYLKVGGKGINESIILTILNIPNIAISLKAGITSTLFEALIKKENINYELYDASGSIRINVKMKDTAIDSSTLILNSKSLDDILKRLRNVNEKDYIILGGSFGKLNKLEKIKFVKELSMLKAKLIIDTADELLIEFLKYKPYLIKPNLEEFKKLTKTLNINQNNFYELCNSILKKGVKNLLLSLGVNGAVFINEEMKIYLPAINVNVISSVGAGDTMLGAFIYKYEETNDFKEALKYGIAAATLKVSTNNKLTKEEIDKIYLNER